MKHLLVFITSRLTLLGSVCACIVLTALLALTSPLQIVISIQPLGSAVSAAPAAILPTVTPPPPPTEPPPSLTATSEPPTEVPPTMISTIESIVTEVPPAPTAVSTFEPTPTEILPVPTAISTVEPTPTEVPHTPTELPPTATEVPPTETPPGSTPLPPTATAAPPVPTEPQPTATEVPPTEAPPAPTAAPPAPTALPPTEVPPAPTETTPAPVASAKRRIERAPDSLPNTADPDQAARFVTSYLPLIGLALAILLMGWLVRSAAFRQRVLVDLSPRVLTPQRIFLGEIQLDPEQIRARWHAGASVTNLVEALALHNRGVSRLALTLAVQEALHS